MTPALIKDLQNTCLPFGVPTLAWAALLILGTGFTYKLFKKLLAQQPQTQKTNLLVFLLPTLLLLPTLSLLEIQKRKTELKTLLVLFQTPSKTLITIDQNPTTREETYKIQELPRYYQISLLGSPTQTTLTSPPYKIPKKVIKVLKDHQKLQENNPT
jgi:hypothetical protein